MELHQSDHALRVVGPTAPSDSDDDSSKFGFVASRLARSLDERVFEPAMKNVSRLRKLISENPIGWNRFSAQMSGNNKIHA